MSTHDNPTPPEQPQAPQEAAQASETPSWVPQDTPAAEQPQPPTQPPTQAPDQSAEIAELRQLVEQLQKQQAASPIGGGAPAPPGDTLGVPEPPEGLPDYAQAWPAEGGLKLDNGDPAPQPWDLRAMGLVVGTSNDGVTTVSSPHTGHHTAFGPGEPDHVSPIVIAHGRPTLGPLAADPAVLEVGRLLAAIGYQTSVSEGRNALGVLDQSVLSAVQRFREDFGVKEDPSGWPVDGERQASVHVGPVTWEALLRVARRIRDEAGQDPRALTHAAG